MYLDSGVQSECSGCQACGNICPVHAIRFESDEKGFLYPKISEELCIHCQRCRKVCPMQESLVGVEADPKIVAAVNRDEKVLMDSSSGGVFPAMSEEILKNGGIVYGAGYDEAFRVCHMGAACEAEAKRFSTSKYVQSDPGPMYELVEKDLRAGKKVLASGTPCQIAGLNRYLKLKNIPADNLFTCDVFCHGVASPRIWSDYLDIIKNRYLDSDAKILDVNMRSKRWPWRERRMEVKTSSGSLDEIVREFPYTQLYYSLYPTRSSCFSCPFTSYKRSGDLSLGDFWNAESAKLEMKRDKGISEVIISTQKGTALLEAIAGKLETEELDRASAWQPSLEFTPKPPKDQEVFWKEYLDEPENREEVMRRYMKGTLIGRLINRMSPVLCKIGLYRIAGRLYKTVFGR